MISGLTFWSTWEGMGGGQVFIRSRKRRQFLSLYSPLFHAHSLVYSTFSIQIGRFHGSLHVCEGQTQGTYQLLPLKDKDNG